MNPTRRQVIEAASAAFALPASEQLAAGFPELEAEPEYAAELEALWSELIELQQEIEDPVIVKKVCYAAGALGNACREASSG